MTTNRGTWRKTINTDTERWIPGFEGSYAVDIEGNLISFKRGKKTFLIGGLDKDGYRKAILCMDGKRHYFRIASLIALAFIGERPDGMVIRHIDGDSLNNRPNNLAYGTQKENIADKEIHGTKLFGEKHGSSILNEAQVLEIRSSQLGSTKLSIKYGVSRSCVDEIKSRRTWKHL